MYLEISDRHSHRAYIESNNQATLVLSNKMYFDNSSSVQFVSNFGSNQAVQKALEHD